jgi:hypothetical protein
VTAAGCAPLTVQAIDCQAPLTVTGSLNVTVT